MSIIDTLVTDRTLADVSEWMRLRALGLSGMSAEELSQWVAGMKGEYKASDLNRVSAAYNYLAGVLSELGAISQHTALKTDWQTGDSPLASDLNACMSAIRRLKNASNADGDLPESFDAMTYEDANNIERVLINIDGRARHIQKSLVFAGELYAGEG